MSKLKVGIIGTGRVAVDWHLPSILEAGGEVIAFSDVVQGRACRYAEEKGVRYAYNDYKELINNEEVDIVAVCTPPVSHEEITVAALKAGKHVYLEKPPAMNTEEMQSITRTAVDKGRMLFSGSNMIFMNELQAAKTMIEEGEFGSIYCIEAFRTVRRAYKKGWHRIKSIAGGGVGFDSTAHRLDWILYLIENSKPVSVNAKTYSYFANLEEPENNSAGYKIMDEAEGLIKEQPKSDIEDTLLAFIQFDNGCSLIIRDMACANMKNESSKLKLFGTKAGVEINMLLKNTTALKLYKENTPGISEDIELQVSNNPNNSHTQAYRYIFECISRGSVNQIHAQRSVMVMKILDAIYKSAKQNGKQIYI